MSMNPSKVLLITLVGPYGEVDVAVRADLPAAELVPAFKELVGTRGNRAGRATGSRENAARSGAEGGPPVRRDPNPAARPTQARQGPPAAQQQGPPAPPQAPTPSHARETWYAPPAGPEPAHPQPPSPTGQSGPPGPGDIPLEGTLADAGIVDGMVLYLYQPREGGS